MKKLNNIVYIVFILIGVYAQGQEFSESDVGFNADLLDLGGINCLESFNESSKKKWKSSRPYKNFQVGKNIRSGSLIFFGEGLSDIQANPDDPNYIDAIQNAVSIASLRAKKQLALYRSVEITREVTERAMEAISSGVPVSDYGGRQEELDQREEAYSKAGLGEKFYMWMDKKLDEWVGEKDSIAEDRSQLEKELENVLSQNVFEEIITTLAYSEIAGMKNAQIQVKENKVCVLSVWTQRTKRWADELGNANYEALANLRPGKSSYTSVIPDKKNTEGLRNLTASYGLQVDVDINGELFLISYAQAASIDRSANSINTARMIAENRARGQIAQFQNEAVDVYENLENIQISTTYVDDTTNNYSERNFTARTKSASRLNIAGVELHDWWATIHPLSEKPVVGVIMVWQPSNAMIIKNSEETEEYDDLGF
jgi:hypothetical protein